MTEFDRRSLLALIGAGAATPAFAQADAPRRDPMAIAPDAPVVAMLVYPKMVALDLIGPLTVFNILRWRVHLVWKDMGPVATDVGIPFAPTMALADAPRAPDVLFGPGGIMGTIACMNDADVCAFLDDRGARAGWVTSVCTGALALAAAGLLRGYDATAHWAVADLLPLMGARHVARRVIRDRNRMTGGGVTAGIDFALTLAAQRRRAEHVGRVPLRGPAGRACASYPDVAAKPRRDVGRVGRASSPARRPVFRVSRAASLHACALRLTHMALCA